MSMLRRDSQRIASNNDTGFGSSTEGTGGRFVNKDGTFNIRREGAFAWTRKSIYNNLLRMPAWKFVLVAVSFFFLVNFLFTGIYLLIGTDQLTGMVQGGFWTRVKETFFFSTETFTTVGYGRVNPVGDGANLVAALEAMSGFMSFAMLSGLMYGRFARPRASMLFSANAVLAPYKQITGLMFRFVEGKDSHTLTDVSVKVNLAMLVMENDQPAYKFYDLELERSKVDSLPMNFTVVHPIDEKSPLWNYTQADMEVADVELYVLIRAFDDVYSAVIQQRTSYTAREIKFGEKFVPMYRESEDGNTTIIELDKLHSTRPAPLS